jgi:hypothetical protein
MARSVKSEARQRRQALTADVEERLLLAGEAGVGQIFCRCARAHGNGDIRYAGTGCELAVGGGDIGRDVVGPVALEKELADRMAGLGQAGLCGGPVSDQGRDLAAEIVGGEVPTIGFGGRGEPGWHINACRAEPPHHLAERRILAPTLATSDLPTLSYQAIEEARSGMSCSSVGKAFASCCWHCARAATGLH